jgi:hypothetical protein
MPCASL